MLHLVKYNFMHELPHFSEELLNSHVFPTEKPQPKGKVAVKV